MKQNNNDTASQNKMGNAPMLKLILTMSLPAMFSMLVQSLYNIIDSIFISEFDTQAFTAITLAFPLQILMISVAVGTGIGINSVVSRRLGEGRTDKASSAATHGIYLAMISAAVFAIIGIFCIRPFFEAFTTDLKVIQYGCDYMYIVMIFSIGIFMQINIEKTLQATGNMIYPMLFQLTGAITNIILDPILIFGLFGMPALGIKGAAIATVTGQFAAMIFSMIILHIKSHDVHIKLKGFRFEKETVKSIYSVGLPSIVMQSMGCVLTTSLNAILIGFGDAAVNVVGAYIRIQSFVFMPVFGLTQGLMPIIGFNFGARNRKRLVDGFKIGLTVATVITISGTILFMVMPKTLLGIFNADAAMLEIGEIAFRLLSLTFIPAGFGVVFATLFQAVGLGTKSLIITVLRQLVLLLPLFYIFSLISINFAWLAFPMAEFAALIVALFFLKSVFKKNIDTVMKKEPHKREKEQSR